MPVLRNVDDAAKRRFNILPFTHASGTPDPTLMEKLRHEWPGILRWFLDGCLDWQMNGLVRPARVIEATATYFEVQDPIGQWLEADAVVEPGNLSRWEAASDLFASWSDYAKAFGAAVGTANELGSDAPIRLSHFGRWVFPDKSDGYFPPANPVRVAERDTSLGSENLCHFVSF